MLLNRLEYALMNNPLRATIQRRFEARRLLAMGGPTPGGRVLEMGCGRGIGIEAIFDLFDAEEVNAFDLDPRMVRLARRRTSRRGSAVSLWVGDATAIPIPDAHYDAVFDFGIIHHVPRWRDAVGEVRRVLKPGGRFFGEEVFEKVTNGFPWKQLLEHPREDRFDHAVFSRGLRDEGLRVLATKQLWGAIGWFVAERDAAA